MFIIYEIKKMKSVGDDMQDNNNTSNDIITHQ